MIELYAHRGGWNEEDWTFSDVGKEMEQPKFSYTSGGNGTFSLENGLTISIQDKYLHNAEHFHSRGIYTSSPKDMGKNVRRSIVCDSFKLKMT